MFPSLADCSTTRPLCSCFLTPRSPSLLCRTNGRRSTRRWIKIGWKSWRCCLRRASNWRRRTRCGQAFFRAAPMLFSIIGLARKSCREHLRSLPTPCFEICVQFQGPQVEQESGISFVLFLSVSVSVSVSVIVFVSVSGQVSACCWLKHCADCFLRSA